MLQKTFTSHPYIPSPRRLNGLGVYAKQLLALVVLLIGFGASQNALAQQYDNAITLTQQPTGASSQSVSYAGLNNDSPYDSYTLLGNSTATPSVPTPNLGTFDLNNNSKLILTGSSIVFLNPTRGAKAASGQLLYRVYLTGATIIPNYSQLNLTTVGTDSYGDVVYSINSANLDLLNGLTSGGNYSIDIKFQITLANGTTNTDPSNNYSLALYITPPPVTPTGGTTVWQSTTTTGGSTDWTLPANWSNGVPTGTSNAIIPAKTNSTLVYPILNNPSYNYAVKNLTLQGNSSSAAAQLTINAATLTVYGDINQPAGGLVGNTTGNTGVTDPTQNSTLVLAGADQIVTGQLVVSDIIIAGSGIKSVINQLVPANILAFRPTSATAGVIVQSAAQDNSSGTISTVFDTTGNSYIQLTAGSTISTVPGEAETNTSYIKGVTRADRAVLTGVLNTFGNIGLDITANHNPGRLFVYRVVGDALTGPLNATAVPIKRQYKIVGDDDSGSNATASSTVDIVFHYLDSADELNGISESNLTMFRTTTNGAPYTLVGGTLNASNNTVTRIALPSLINYSLTLGDKTNPLPVSLTAFAAVRSNANTLLSWTTATELNNKGFNVQVSSDGLKFRTLAFVASQSPNSNQELNYKYTDTEANKAGIRYYRLEQVDEDGKVNYSPVRAVNFAGVAASSAALVAFPNPFTETVGLTLDGATVTDGAAHVKLVDMTGRTVREQQLTLNNASLSLGDLSALRSGLYIARVTLPDGSTQTVRIQKL